MGTRPQLTCCSRWVLLRTDACQACLCCCAGVLSAAPPARRQPRYAHISPPQPTPDLPRPPPQAVSALDSSLVSVGAMQMSDAPAAVDALLQCLKQFQSRMGQLPKGVPLDAARRHLRLEKVREVPLSAARRHLDGPCTGLTQRASSTCDSARRCWPAATTLNPQP
jgi:hypothetical protein